MKRNTPLALALMVLTAPEAAASQGVGGTSCGFAATPLAFGGYTASSSSPADFTATLTVTCTGSGPGLVPVRATVALLGGSSERRLAVGAGRLRYQLYLDPARTVLWGDGAGGSQTAAVSGVVGPSTVFRWSLTVYGRLLARQSDALAGAYADQITAVLNY